MNEETERVYTRVALQMKSCWFTIYYSGKFLRQNLPGSSIANNQSQLNSDENGNVFQYFKLFMEAGSKIVVKKTNHCQMEFHSGIRYTFFVDDLLILYDIRP